MKSFQRIITVLLITIYSVTFGQDVVADYVIPTGIAALNFVAADMKFKEMAKEISQFRSKEFIANYIIGPAGDSEIRFETESLVSDNDAGLISVAFNCNQVDKNGLLLAFMGLNRDATGNIGNAYGFRYIPLTEAQKLLSRIDAVKEQHKKYLSADNDVNNVYIEFEDIKFILYKDGGEKIRVFWNGFEVIWERTAFDRTKRRLDKWFE